MPLRPFLIVAAYTLGVGASLADEVLYTYEGDVLPYDASAGWLVFDPCEYPCNESLADGRFILNWPEPGNLANYHYWIAQPPEGPPPRSGSSGAFAPITRSVCTFTRVTRRFM